MLGDINAPSCIELRNLIDTQSMDTIRTRCLAYAENIILPIFEKRRPYDHLGRSVAWRGATRRVEAQCKIKRLRDWVWQNQNNRSILHANRLNDGRRNRIYSCTQDRPFQKKAYLKVDAVINYNYRPRFHSCLFHHNSAVRVHRIWI